MWFIGVEVEQETSAPPPKKSPGSAPDITSQSGKNLQTFVWWGGKFVPLTIQMSVKLRDFEKLYLH